MMPYLPDGVYGTHLWRTREDWNADDDPQLRLHRVWCGLVVAAKELVPSTVYDPLRAATTPSEASPTAPICEACITVFKLSYPDRSG
jgi:hypothetical protein